MKLVEYSGLWSAIQQFPLDDPNAEITFSRKLSAKQNWSPTFTERVIEEYRKFIFLCCISPKGASPSQVVDEAWHLHLTYTKSYWIDLCKNTLSKEIHHHPSLGGDEEDHKHIEWYKDTLALYQSVFESPPPDDIWPLPKEHLLIPEPAWHIRSEMIALIIMSLLVPLTVSAYLFKKLSPYSLDGPRFLIFFPLLAISCIIGYFIFQEERTRTLKNLVLEYFPSNATVFQLAQFLFGKHRAVQAAIVDLIRRNLLGLTTDKKFILHQNWYNNTPDEQNPLIAGFIGEKDNCVSYDMIACNWHNEQASQHPALQQLYWFAWQEESILAKYHILIIPFVTGVMRLFQGLANGKPVSLLIIEMMVFIAIVLIIRETTSRKMVVFKYAEELANRQNDQSLIYADNIVWQFALKGNRAIEWFSDGLVLAGIFTAYPVINHLRTFEANGSCSSCGGGSGGCGGGGCGGGGCGGGCGGCGSN